MLERAGEPQAALQLIEQVVRDHARDPRPMVARSQLKAAGGDLPAALLDADAAIALNNESGDAHLARARILAVRGETNAALVSARRACDLLPSNFDAHYLAAALHGQLGETYAAVPYLVRAWTSRGSSAKPVEAALERALDEYEALSATSLVALARADGDRNDAARALKWSARAAARYPKDAEVARTRAELLRRFERPSEALAEWQRVCSLDTNDPYAAEACAKLQLDLGDVTGAKESLRAALQRAQTLPDLKERRATTQRIEVALARL
jgi:tetratricopeptide (TPR) repeat protein